MEESCTIVWKPLATKYETEIQIELYYILNWLLLFNERQ